MPEKKKKKSDQVMVHLVCGGEVKLKETSDIFAAVDFDRKFAGSDLRCVNYSECLRSVNFPRNSIPCKTTVNNF